MVAGDVYIKAEGNVTVYFIIKIYSVAFIYWINLFHYIKKIFKRFAPLVVN